MHAPPSFLSERFTCPRCGTYAQQHFHSLSEVIFTSTCTACRKHCVWYNRELIHPINSGAPLANEDLPDDVKADPKKKKKTGRDPVKLDKVVVSDDGKKVLLSIPDIREVNNMVIKYKLKGADGSEVKSEIDNTINKVLDQ